MKQISIVNDLSKNPDYKFMIMKFFGQNTREVAMAQIFFFSSGKLSFMRRDKNMWDHFCFIDWIKSHHTYLSIDDLKYQSDEVSRLSFALFIYFMCFFLHSWQQFASILKITTNIIAASYFHSWPIIFELSSFCVFFDCFVAFWSIYEWFRWHFFK